MLGFICFMLEDLSMCFTLPLVIRSGELEQAYFVPCPNIHPYEILCWSDFIGLIYRSNNNTANKKNLFRCGRVPCGPDKEYSCEQRGAKYSKPCVPHDDAPRSFETYDGKVTDLPLRVSVYS